jgi:IS1 family transposase/transposase-like protein
LGHLYYFCGFKTAKIEKMGSLCFKRVGEKKLCVHCGSHMIKYGKSKTGKQRYQCKTCGKVQQINYRYKAYEKTVNNNIISLTKEGVGIRGLSRLLSIAQNTVLSRIKQIAKGIKSPTLLSYHNYEVDELRTFIKNKKKLIWVVCAYCRNTKQIVRYSVGRRTNNTLIKVIDSLQLASAKRIYTDKLRQYKTLINEKIHSVKQYGTNHVERFHLSLRTHLKRLCRRTICYSRSTLMLESG